MKFSIQARSLLIALAVGAMPLAAHGATEYVSTDHWQFSYSNDGLEGIVVKNLWYTSSEGERAKVADHVAMEFFRVIYQDHAAGPYSDNFMLNSPQLYLGCPDVYEEVPYNLCTVGPEGCEAGTDYPGCSDSLAWTPPEDGESVCSQSSEGGSVRLTAQGGYNCGQYRFVETFTFNDDGTIVLHLAAKGVQATDGEGNGREHMHYAYFRLDVDADGAQNIVSVNGMEQVEESALDLGGDLSTQGGSGDVPNRFDFVNADSGRSVWVWVPKADTRYHEAIHGEATWLDWSQKDAWVQSFHPEEEVAVKRKSLLGPPIGQCGGDEPKNYDTTTPGNSRVNREATLTEISETSVQSSRFNPSHVEGAEALGEDTLLWLNTPMYHDTDAASTDHGCHDIEVRLRASWGS